MGVRDGWTTVPLGLLVVSASLEVNPGWDGSVIFNNVPLVEETPTRGSLN